MSVQAAQRPEAPLAAPHLLGRRGPGRQDGAGAGLGKGRAGRRAGPARGGARGAGRAGRLPARGSPGPALWGSAAEAPAHCALRPLPDNPAGPRCARARRRRRRERLGSAAGECARARARRRGRRPGPRGPRAGGPGSALRTPGTPAAGSTWTPGCGGTGARSPAARGGRGALQAVPLFLQLKAWGSDCSKGGRKNPGFRVSRPLSLVGRDRGGTPRPPPPRWIGQPLCPASVRGGAAPPAPADRGPLAPTSLQKPREEPPAV